MMFKIVNLIKSYPTLHLMPSILSSTPPMITMYSKLNILLKPISNMFMFLEKTQKLRVIN